MNHDAIDPKSLKTPDTFQKKGGQVFTFLVQQRVLFLTVIGIVVTVAVGSYSYNLWKDRQLEKDWEKLQVVMKAPEAERIGKLKAVCGELKGRPLEYCAASLGDLLVEEAKKQIAKDVNAVPAEGNQAIEWYTKALDSGSLLDSEKQLLLMNRGAAYALLKNWDGAFKDYEAASQITAEGRPLAMLELAEIHLVRGNNDKAIEVYEKLSGEFKSTEAGKMAKNILRRMKSPIFGGSKS